MKRFIWLILPLFLTVGCATSADRAAYHTAQAESIKAQMETQMIAMRSIKPMFSIEAKDGENIVMSGVKKFEIYAPAKVPDIKGIEQYKDEYIPVYLSAMNLLGIPIGMAVQGYFAAELIKAASQGGNIYYGDNSPYQGVSGGTGIGMSNSAIGVTGRDGNPTVSVPTTTTTTTTLTTTAPTTK